MIREYDVAIAGGGPAGASAGITLARDGWRVLLAEAEPLPAFRIGEAVPPSARTLLARLGIPTRDLDRDHRAAHGTVSAWDTGALSHNDFLFALHGDGLSLDRVKFDSVLRRTATDAGVDVHAGARLTLDGDPGDLAADTIALRIKRNTTTTTVRARMLVDAGGRSAVLSRRRGAVRLHYDRLLAFHLTLSCREDDDRLASTLVESVFDGWWYTALLPSRRRLVVFLTDADLVDRSALLTASGLWSRLHLTHHVAALVERHGYQPASPARAVDASSGRLDRVADSHVVAVGDAAQSFDPLSSKGIANALYTGIRGAECVAATLRGDGQARARYDQHLSLIFETYLGQLTDVYRQAVQWSDAPFWRRRARGYAGGATRFRDATSASAN